MHISITYCVQWNYEPKASGLAAEIKNKIGVDAELIGGGGGIFDVKADDVMVFSKHKEGRFPENQEVIEALEKMWGVRC